jgi:hypothetical protein
MPAAVDTAEQDSLNDAIISDRRAEVVIGILGLCSHSLPLRPIAFRVLLLLCQHLRCRPCCA